jgi:hypothetical protein
LIGASAVRRGFAAAGEGAEKTHFIIGRRIMSVHGRFSIGLFCLVASVGTLWPRGGAFGQCLVVPDHFKPDCNANGIPDECELDCGLPNGPCDVEGCGLSEDCNANRIPDECELDPQAFALAITEIAFSGSTVGGTEIAVRSCRSKVRNDRPDLDNVVKGA